MYKYKLIFSAFWLYQLVEQLMKAKKYDDSDEVGITCKDRQFFFNDMPDKKGMVEAKEDFEAHVSVAQLTRLKKILGALQDQPIVMFFTDSNWISFQADI